VSGPVDAGTQTADATSQRNPGEFVEAGVDQNANPVPDPVAFIDGAVKMRRDSIGQGESDAAWI
jgi:hypothetical protein